MRLLPGSYVTSTPESGFARSAVDDGAGEVGVAMLVGGDTVTLAEPENAGHLGGVDEVVTVLFVHGRSVYWWRQRLTWTAHPVRC